jgi:superfamily II RNA helicase
MPVICSSVFPQIEESYQDSFAEFPYPLSDFQKHAIKAIVDGHHVLVCAPTGSGKTLPAEFAIRHFISQGRRVIYTSPIKALSNQKYHEFSRKFAPFGITVGLCTGDIKTNPTADLLIMTAEILNNRLFQLDNSSQESGIISNLSFTMDINTKLAAVIMDEVHYINDESRGHVWEQTILTLPPQIQMIMLSATLDSPEKFAEWIESTRPLSNPLKSVYLAQTKTRIVPLTHYAYFPPAPQALTKAVKSTPLEPLVKQQTNNLITLQTAHNVFQSASYKSASQLYEIWQENINGHTSRKNVLNSLATYMKGADDMDIDDTMLPAIVFTLSRKQVEESAADITANILAFDSKIPYTAAHECEQIIRRLPNWREYQELPEYKSLVKLLEKGVGIHHSGMIPVLREIVELRISEKKIFLLFATESFAIGLDCPIRTAVFTGLTKFDGKEDRFLYAHEYTQMAGRAGRRGIDTVGHVIHLPLLFRKGMPSELAYKGILSNKPQILVSKFNIDYKMILSLVKKGIASDFHQFVERSMSKNSILGELNELDRELEQMKFNQTILQNSIQHIRTPLDKCQEYESLAGQLKTAVNKKRRDLERRLQTIKDQYKYVLEDITLVSKMRGLETAINNKETDIEDTAEYLKTQTNIVCDIMRNSGILAKINDSGMYELTSPLGIIAAQFAEVHPIPLAKLIVSENWFKGWSSRELIGVLSVFVDVRLPEQERAVEPLCENTRVKNAIILLQSYYDGVRDMENANKCYTGIKYEGALCFDMSDAMMEWCVLTEEVECKVWLRDIVAANISAGDFAKACMKLSATVKEMIAMCEILIQVVGSNALELAHVLSNIDALILKHIVTTQSLYL